MHRQPAAGPIGVHRRHLSLVAVWLTDYKGSKFGWGEQR
jgi:hypothetical protein